MCCFVFQVLAMWYVNMERRKGFVTSGIQTIYWMVSSICGVVLVYSDRVNKVSSIQ